MSEKSGIPLAIDIFATADAADEIVSVMHRAFAEYTAKGETSGAMLETPQTLREELAAGTRIAVMREHGEIIASVKHAPAGDGTLYFSRLAVDPAHRGHGVARELVRALRAQAQAESLQGLSCTVRAGEAGNIALYEHLGMRITSQGTRVSRTGATLAVVTMRDGDGNSSVGATSLHGESATVVRTAEVLGR
ncbi:GNAT family N-acetyltransferase [uncultured Microbacterium sp.]|uniref:GNAT family N-acetyltransferase n=1 Tax=uncultured Microbacterium sp. TaxID=191216 RepID=UPI00262CB088|nr:GNAT family N-acetyltransferase [uncultured Microbacterium sp.]